MPPLIQDDFIAPHSLVARVLSAPPSQHVRLGREHKGEGIIEGGLNGGVDCLLPEGCAGTGPQGPLTVTPLAPGTLPTSVPSYPRMTVLPLPSPSAVPTGLSQGPSVDAAHQSANRAGAIAGAVIASFVGLMVMLLLLYYYVRHRKKSRVAPSSEFLRPDRRGEHVVVSSPFTRIVSQYDRDIDYPSLAVPPPPYARGSYIQPILTKPMR
ncbi:hypothetical protein AX16_003770 [Volvariella volvacea WC 439]|nr:hypothetical protein AX16_003770 [Volvariella volvacea WC 439]